MKFKSDSGEEIDLSFESDLLVTSFYLTGKDSPPAVLRTRGQESSAVINHIRKIGR